MKSEGTVVVSEMVFPFFRREVTGWKIRVFEVDKRIE